jgi:dihydrolipoamide dehydrogenase
VTDIASGEDAVTFTYGDQQGDAEWLVIAAGRGPDVEGLGLDAAGVTIGDDGLIAVDDRQRTSRAGVYAIGDIVHGPALAHKASEEGVIAAEAIAGHQPQPLAYADIPRATFCTPNVGSMGLTEAQAKEAGHDVTVGKVPYGAVGAGTVYGDRTGMVKLVGDRKYGEILGAHIVGAKATDLIQEVVNAKLLEGGYPELATMIHGHPTMSEAILEAARAADGWLIHG